MLESDEGEMGILFTVERFLDGRRMRTLLSEDNPLGVSRTEAKETMGIDILWGPKISLLFRPKFPIRSSWIHKWVKSRIKQPPKPLSVEKVLCGSGFVPTESTRASSWAHCGLSAYRVGLNVKIPENHWLRGLQMLQFVNGPDP